jgi:hypothetical protein
MVMGIYISARDHSMSVFLIEYALWVALASYVFAFRGSVFGAMIRHFDQETEQLYRVKRAYESHFPGNVLTRSGCMCIVSWPGIYARSWDALVEKSKHNALSAAVVFLPEHTADFGKHGTDKCYCVEMYGEVKPWGCRWFQLWREMVDTAVAREQKLMVYYFNGMRGRGKISSWDICCDDAIKRDFFYAKKACVLAALPAGERMRLEALPNLLRDDALGGEPGSERADEEERIFVCSLTEEEQEFWLSHKGLGNSQKAEVAWLEKHGYTYEEREVQMFTEDRRRSQIALLSTGALDLGATGADTQHVL